MERVDNRVFGRGSLYCRANSRGSVDCSGQRENIRSVILPPFQLWCTETPINTSLNTKKKEESILEQKRLESLVILRKKERIFTL